MNRGKLKSDSRTRNRKTKGALKGTGRLLNTKGLPLFNTRIEAIILVVFAAGLYANTLFHGFALDDTMMITHNEFTKEGIQGIGKILTNDAFTGFHGEDKNLLPGGRYRPLSQIMFAVEYELFGENPFPGHLINVLLYALGCMLLYKMLRVLFEHERKGLWRFSIPFVIALIFTVHPLHTEVVANIKSRDEILGLIGFSLLGLMALKYIRNNRRALLFTIVPVFLLAMLSKESAITFLAAIPLMLIYYQRSFSKVMLHVFAAMLAGLVAYLALRIGAIGVPRGGVSNMELLNDPFLHASGSERLATLFYTWIKYVGLILFPNHLTHDYYPWHIVYKTFANGAVLLSIVFFAGFAIYSVRRIRKPDMPSLGFLLFVILFSSQSNLVVNIGSFMNERFVFIALLGIIIVVVWFLTGWLASKLKQNEVFVMIVVFAVVAGFSAKTISRNRVWKDDYTLFTTDVQISVNSAKVNTSAGGAYYDKALLTENEEVRKTLLQKAIHHFERGTQLHPTYLDGHLALGNAYLYSEEYLKALKSYQACLRISPNYPKALQNIKVLAARSFQAKDYETTVAACRTLLSVNPGELQAGIDYAEALLYNRDLGEAENILDSLYYLAPDDAKVNHLQGQLWGRYLAFEPGTSPDQRQRYLLRSRDYLEKAVRLEPENYGMTENLAIVYGLTGDAGRALVFFKKALEMMMSKEQEAGEDANSLRVFHEDLARIHRNIGDTYRGMSDVKNALEHYGKSLEYNPDDPVVVTQTAAIYKSTGDKKRAADILQEYLLRNPGDPLAQDMLKKLF